MGFLAKSLCLGVFSARHKESREETLEVSDMLQEFSGSGVAVFRRSSKGKSQETAGNRFLHIALLFRGPDDALPILMETG